MASFQQTAGSGVVAVATPLPALAAVSADLSQLLLEPAPSAVVIRTEAAVVALSPAAAPLPRSGQLFPRGF